MYLRLLISQLINNLTLIMIKDDVAVDYKIFLKSRVRKKSVQKKSVQEKWGHKMY